jgi:hypothetical protein
VAAHTLSQPTIQGIILRARCAWGGLVGPWEGGGTGLGMEGGRQEESGDFETLLTSGASGVSHASS